MASPQFETTTEVVTLLGGKKVLKWNIAERDELREVIRKGLPFSALETFVHAMGISTIVAAKVLGLAP